MSDIWEISQPILKCAYVSGIQSVVKRQASKQAGKNIQHNYPQKNTVKPGYQNPLYLFFVFFCFAHWFVIPFEPVGPTL